MRSWAPLRGLSLSAIAFDYGDAVMVLFHLGLAMREGMHYHIRWAGSKVDWEPFVTRQDAELAASQLARPGETFTLEAVDDKACVPCLKSYANLHRNDTIDDAEVNS